MIKNVVFDIGKVLIRWEPLEMCMRICPDKETAGKVCDSTYLAPRWGGLDAGALTVAQAIEESVAELGEKFRPYITAAYNDFVSLAQPIEEGLALAKKLHSEGYKLYLASNFNERVYALYERLNLGDIFSGYIYSFEEKIIKPDPEFFVRLAKRYSLKLDECAFIDDRPENVAAAVSVGMLGCVYRDNPDEIYGIIKN